MQFIAKASSKMPISADQARLPALSHEWLSFNVGAEEYAVDLLQVQEIRTFEKPTRLFDTPPNMLGVVDLRGTIVPLLDLRQRFHTARSDSNETQVVIIAAIRNALTGLVVDSVNDVVSLDEKQFRQMPALGNQAAAHVLALATCGDRTFILSDLARLADLALAPGSSTVAAH